MGFVKASSVRTRVLRELAGQPMTPKEIATRLTVHFSQVSSALKGMVAKGIVVSLTHDRRKGKMYAITPLGTSVLGRL